MNKPTTNTAPTHHLFVVKGEGAKVFWTNVGVGWQHADGNGMNLTLSLLPLDGRIVIRTAKEAKTTGKGRGQ